jgi:hypothetical protein
METDPLLVLLWIAALRRRSLGTVLRELEDYPRIYRPYARA